MYYLTPANFPRRYLPLPLALATINVLQLQRLRGAQRCPKLAVF
jgi:hypothetical protein